MDRYAPIPRLLHARSPDTPKESGKSGRKQEKSSSEPGIYITNSADRRTSDNDSGNDILAHFQGPKSRRRKTSGRVPGRYGRPGDLERSRVGAPGESIAGCAGWRR